MSSSPTQFPIERDGESVGVKQSFTPHESVFPAQL